MLYTVEEAEKDRAEFERLAIEADKNGQKLYAGICRIKAYNCLKLVGMKRVHKPNPGPYSKNNPQYCVNCGKPKELWSEREECIGK